MINLYSTILAYNCISHRGVHSLPLSSATIIDREEKKKYMKEEKQTINYADEHAYSHQLGLMFGTIAKIKQNRKYAQTDQKKAKKRRRENMSRNMPFN